MMESRLFVLVQNNYFDPEHDGERIITLTQSMMESFICFHYRTITLTQSMMESSLFVLLQNNYFDSEHDGEQFICFITEQLL